MGDGLSGTGGDAGVRAGDYGLVGDDGAADEFGEAGDGGSDAGWRGRDEDGVRAGDGSEREYRQGAGVRGVGAFHGRDPGRSGFYRQADGPEIPEDIRASDLDGQVRAELLSLAKPIADTVARRLVATGQLIDEDPEQALAHAMLARRLASRVAIVREAVGLAAYHAGEWQTAIAELRTYHRMTGRQNHLAVLADSERALGRPERAVDIFRSADRGALDPADAIELLIVAAGARRDLGQTDAAVTMLQVRELTADAPWAARLRYAYADALLAAGRREEAREWFSRALDADDEDATDAAERLLELDGVVLDTDEDDEDDDADENAVDAELDDGKADDFEDEVDGEADRGEEDDDVDRDMEADGVEDVDAQADGGGEDDDVERDTEADGVEDVDAEADGREEEDDVEHDAEAGREDGDAVGDDVQGELDDGDEGADARDEDDEPGDGDRQDASEIDDEHAGGAEGHDAEGASDGGDARDDGAANDGGVLGDAEGGGVEEKDGGLGGGEGVEGGVPDGKVGETRADG